MQTMRRVGRSRPCTDPERWTEPEFLRFMVHIQGLRRRARSGRESTALQRLRYIRQLEREGVAVRPPDEDSWLDWVDGRLDAGDHLWSLDNHRKAMLSLLAFMGEPVWQSITRPFPRSLKAWDLVPDHVVAELTTRHDLHPGRYLSELLRAVFRWGFRMGIRPTSEFVTLDLDHIDRANRRVDIWDSKSNQWRRIGKVHPEILDEMFEYIDGPRAEVAAPPERAVFVGRHGNRLHPTYLARLMHNAGVQLWPEFRPYQCRYWYATRRLIQTDFNVYVVARELGDTVQTVERHYLHLATVDPRLPAHGVVREGLAVSAAD